MTHNTTVISVRVRKEVKEALEEAGVDISKALRQYLEDLLWRVRLKEEVRNLRKVLEAIKPSEQGFSVKSVREDRESHRPLSVS